MINSIYALTSLSNWFVTINVLKITFGFCNLSSEMYNLFWILVIIFYLVKVVKTDCSKSAFDHL